jgi:hypothetical protein
MKRKVSVAVKALAAVAMALLLSSCIKLNMDLTVSSDNTVSGTVIFAVDKQLLEATGQTADQVMGENPFASPGAEGMTSSSYDDGKYVGQKVTFDAVPITQFSGAGAEDLKIVREGDEFKVSGVLDLSGTTGETGGSGSDGIAQQALGTADVRITMAFPGDVISSNGTIDGNTVTWVPKVGERTEIQAVASAIPSSSSFPWLWIAIGGAAVVVLLAIVLWVAARRRGKKGGEVPVAVGSVATGGADAETPGETLPPLPPPPGEMP